MSAWRQGSGSGAALWVALALLASLAACGAAARGEPWADAVGISAVEETADGPWGAENWADRSLLGTGYGGHRSHCYDHHPPNFLCNCALVDHPTMTSIKQAFAPGHITCTPTCLRHPPHLCYLKNCDLADDHEEVICVQDGCGIRIDHDLMTTVMSGQCFLNVTLQLWDCGDVALDLPSHKFISTGECMSVCKGQELACTFPTRYYAPLSEFHPIPGHAFNGSKPADDPASAPAPRSHAPASPRPKARKTGRGKTTPAPAPSATPSQAGTGSSPAHGAGAATPGKGAPGTATVAPSPGAAENGAGTVPAGGRSPQPPSTSGDGAPPAPPVVQGGSQAPTPAPAPAPGAAVAIDGLSETTGGAASPGSAGQAAGEDGTSAGGQTAASGPAGAPQVGMERKGKDRSLPLSPSDAQVPAQATGDAGSVPTPAAGPTTATGMERKSKDRSLPLPPADAEAPAQATDTSTPAAGPTVATDAAGAEAPGVATVGPGNATTPSAAAEAPVTVDLDAPDGASVPSGSETAPSPADATARGLAPSPANGTGEGPSLAPGDATSEAPAPAESNLTADGPAPAPGNATGEAPAPAPANVTDEAPAPAPANVTDKVPAPAPGNETTGPAPAPAPENDTTPAPAPMVDTPAPAPEMIDDERGPAPAPVETDETAAAPAAATSSGPSRVSPPSDAGDAVYLGPWRECSSLCANGGPSVRERGQYCVSSAGTPAPQEVCEGLDASGDTTEECEVEACSSLPAYNKLSQWSACDASCGGGMRTRTATCVNGTGDPIDESNCEVVDQNLLEKECNTMPCESPHYTVGAWGECNAPCGGGNRTRGVTCMVAITFNGDGNGNGQQPSEVCEEEGLVKPREEEPCNIFACLTSSNKRKLMQDPMQDSCSGKTCSGRGSCVQGECICEGEFTGADCELDADGFLICPEGSVPDASGGCCEGRIDVEGTCCEGGQELDEAGLCCADGIDACGVCGGDGLFVDLSGACCSTFLDGNGLCCSTGDIDGCGVCSGDGSSCLSRLEMTVQVADAAISNSGLEDCLAQRINEAVPVDAEEFEPKLVSRTGQDTDLVVVVETAGLPLSAATLERELASGPDTTRSLLQQDNACEILSVSASSKVALCGNNVCEFGEMPGAPRFSADNPLTCQQDCPFTFTACPAPVSSDDGTLRFCSANGRCLFTSNGICDCFAGYIGDSCAECDVGFAEVDGKCVVAAAAGLGTAPEVVPRGVIGDGDSGTSDSVVLPVAIGAGVALLLAMIVVALLVKKYRQRQDGDVMTTITSDDKKVMDSGAGPYKGGHPQDGGHTKSLSDFWRSFISTISTPRRTPRDYVEAPDAEVSQTPVTPGQYFNSGDVSVGEDRQLDAMSPGGSPPMASSLADSAPEIRSYPLDFTGEEGVYTPSQRVNIIPVTASVDASGTPLEVARNLGYGAMAGEAGEAGEGEVASYPVRLSGSPTQSDYRSAASTPTGEFRDAYPVRISDSSSRSPTPELPAGFPVQLSEGDSRASTPAGERQLDGYPLRRSDISSRSATPPDLAGNTPPWLREAVGPGLPAGGRRVEAYPVRLSDVSARSSVSADQPMPGSFAVALSEGGDSRASTPYSEARVEGFPVRVSDVTSRSATPPEGLMPGSFPVELSEDGSRASTPGVQAYPVRASDVSSRSATTGGRPSGGAEPGPGGRRVEAVSHPVRLSDVSSRGSTPEMTEGMRRAFPVRLRLSSSGTSTPEMPGSFPVALSEGGDSRASTPLGGPQLESRPVRLSDISAVSGVSTERGLPPPEGQRVEAYPVHLSDPDSRASTPGLPGSFPVALSEGGTSRASTPAGGPQLESRPVRVSDASAVSTERGLPLSPDSSSQPATPVTSPSPLAGRPVRLSDISTVSGASGPTRTSPGAFPVEQSDEDSQASTPSGGPRVAAYPVRLSDASRTSTPEMPGSFPVALSEGGDSRASTPVGGPQLESRPVRLSDVSTISAPSTQRASAEGGMQVSQPRTIPATEGREGSGGSTPFGSPRIEGRPVRISDVSSVSAGVERAEPGSFPVALSEGGDSRASTPAGSPQLESSPVRLSGGSAVSGVSTERAVPGSFPVALSEGGDSRASTPSGGPVLESRPVRVSDASGASWMDREGPGSFPVAMSDDGSSRASTPAGGPELESRPVRVSDVSSASGLSAYRGLPGVFPAATTPAVARPVAATEGVRVQAIQASAHQSDGSSRASTPEIPRTSPAVGTGSSRASTPGSIPQLESRPVRLSDSSNQSGPAAEPVAPDSFPIAVSEDGTSRASTPAGGPVLESRPVRLSDVSAVSGASTERALPGGLPVATSEEGSRTSTPASMPVPQSFPLAWSEGGSRASTPAGGASEPFQMRVSDIHSAAGSGSPRAGVEGFPIQFSDADSRASTPVGDLASRSSYERVSGERGRSPAGDFPLDAGYYAADSRARAATPPRRAPSPARFPEHGEGATPPTTPRTAAGGFPVPAGYLSGGAAQQPRGLAVTSSESWRGASAPASSAPASPPVRGASLPHSGVEVASGALGSEFERGSSTGSGAWGPRASSPPLEVGYYATPTGSAPVRAPSGGAQAAVSGFPIQLSDTSSRASTPASLPQSSGVAARSTEGAGGQPGTPVSSSPGRIQNFPIQASEGSSRASTPMSTGAPGRDSGVSQSPSPSPPAGVQGFAINISDDASSVSSFGQGGQAPPPQLSGFPIDMSDTASMASSSAPSTPRRP